MALTTITNSMVSVNAIQGTLIADNAITAVHIATNAVSGTLIADNAITATHIAQNIITVTQLADDAVEGAKIADGVITTNHLNKAMISSQTEVSVATGDFVLLGDTSDSNNLKKAPISSILAGTLTTAAQTNITSVGTLSSLTISGTTKLDGGTGYFKDGVGNSYGSGWDVDADDFATWINFQGYQGGTARFRDLRIGTGKEAGMAIFDGSTGNVGIGSLTAPATQLQLIRTGESMIRMGYSTTQFGQVGRNSDGTYELSCYENGGVLKFGTSTTNGATTERMRIDANGRVTFGPDAADIQIDPASTNSNNNLIYMRGNASGDKSSIQMNHYGNADYHIGVGHVGDGKFNIANELTGNDFVIDTAGKVGIGTSTPAAALEVVRGDASHAMIVGAPQGSGRVILFKDNHASPNKYNWLVGSQYTINHGFEITPSTAVGGTTFSSPSIAILESGNVGIGNSNPSVALDVTGAAKISSTLDLTSHLDMPDGAYIKLGTSDDLLIYHDGANSYVEDDGIGDLRLKGSTVRLQGTGGTNLLVGITSGATTLYHNNAAKIATASDGVAVVAGQKLYIDSGSDSYIHEVSANNMAFTVGGNTKMNLTSSGLDISSGFIPDEYTPIYDTSATGFDSSASADTWYEITAGPSDWNGYGTDHKSWSYIIRFFWTSGVASKGYNHRVTVMTGNIASNTGYNSGSFTTCQMGDYDDGSTLSGPIFASHHTSVEAEGNFKCAVKWTSEGSGGDPIRMYIKTNAVPTGTVSMKIWRY